MLGVSVISGTDIMLVCIFLSVSCGQAGRAVQHLLRFACRASPPTFCYMLFLVFLLQYCLGFCPCVWAFLACCDVSTCCRFRRFSYFSSSLISPSLSLPFICICTSYDTSVRPCPLPLNKTRLTGGWKLRWRRSRTNAGMWDDLRPSRNNCTR